MLQTSQTAYQQLFLLLRSLISFAEIKCTVISCDELIYCCVVLRNVGSKDFSVQITLYALRIHYGSEIRGTFKVASKNDYHIPNNCYLK